MLKTQADIQQHLRHNFTVNLLEGGFFGMALGLASYVTVIPLFVADLTESTILIGMIAALQAIGWQVPQLFFSNIVARLRLYKPMVVFMTAHERIPYFGLALLAFFVPEMDKQLALILTFLLIIWQTMGGGFTANAWLSMISKIIPPHRRGTFFGIQGAASHFMASVGAVAAGYILGTWAFPGNYVMCFFLAGLAMTASWILLASTREPEREPSRHVVDGGKLWANLGRILRQDRSFVWFMVARGFFQFSAMGIGFYTIYAVRQFGMSPEIAGLMTGLMLLTQTISSSVFGWMGDRWGHVRLFVWSSLAMAASAGFALIASELVWFYLVFALGGIVMNAQWATLIAITVNYGSDDDRPFYIGLSNTLTAPVVLFAPMIGGFLADTVNFDATFAICIVTGLIAAALGHFVIQDPGKQKNEFQ